MADCPTIDDLDPVDIPGLLPIDPTSGGTLLPGCDLAKLKTTDCLLATGPFGTVEMTYDSGTSRWISVTAVAYPNGTGLLNFWFANGQLHMSLDGLELLHCGNNCWRGGPLTGHVAASGADCAGTTFSVCVTCVCCAIAGWDGPGWYCVDIGNGCEPMLLTDDDRCDDTLTICSGPYANEAAAQADCGPPVVTNCCASMPQILYATFGGNLAYLGTLTMTYSAVNSRWESAVVDICQPGGATAPFLFSCPVNTFQLNGGTAINTTGTLVNCDPFEWTKNGNMAFAGSCGGVAYTVVITETPP